MFDICWSVCGRLFQAAGAAYENARWPNFNRVRGCSYRSLLLCSDVLIQYTAITWLKEFVGLSGPSMLSFVSGILSAVLPCLAYDDEAQISILNCVHQS